MSIDSKLILEIRKKTNVGMMDIKNALEEAGQDIDKAITILKEKGLSKAAKKQERETEAGVVVSYVHLNKVGAIVAVNCETDFVAKTDEFAELAKAIASQIVAVNPNDNTELLASLYFKDESLTVNDLIINAIAKLGENISIGNFYRLSL